MIDFKESLKIFEYKKNSIKDYINVNIESAKKEKYCLHEFLYEEECPKRFGLYLEKAIKKYTSFLSDFEVIEKPFIKNRQADLLFIDKQNKYVYFFEIKTNINNDSEKKVSVVDKIKDIEGFIINNSLKKEDFCNYKIISGILLLTNFFECGIKYGKNKNINVYSLDEYLSFVGINHKEEEIVIFFNNLLSLIREANKDKIILN